MRDRGACFVHKGREAKSKVGGWTRSLDSEEEEEQDRGEVRRATVTTRGDYSLSSSLLNLSLSADTVVTRDSSWSSVVRFRSGRVGSGPNESHPLERCRSCA